MEEKIQISINDVGKSYRVYNKRFDFLKEALTGRSYHREKPVLKNINLQISQGEVVGIIGRNGAGKSTLLKIIAGTLSASEGTVELKGRTSAILELGTGFDPTRSGRENVRMSALMRGMSIAEVEERFDSIVDFAELRSVIDEPFQTYSSGMQARLAFAAAVSVNADILIIDEALAAGDIKFAAKCLQRIHEICKSGVTALFVSHVSYHVMQLCSRAVWIDEGEIKLVGPPVDVVRAYEYQMHREMQSEHIGIQFEEEQTESAAPAPEAATVEELAQQEATHQDEIAAGDNDVTSQSNPLIEDKDHGILDSIVPRADDRSNQPTTEIEIETETETETETEESVFVDYGLQSDRNEANSKPTAAITEPNLSSQNKKCGTTPNYDQPTGSDLPERFSSGKYAIRTIKFMDEQGANTTAVRFGETLRLRVTYECLMSELPEHSCGLAVAFNRTSDFEAVMYFNTSYPHSDDELRDYHKYPFRSYLGKTGCIEATIPSMQLTTGRYWVSLGILPNHPGPHEFYEYLHCQYQLSVLANGYEEPSVFYPIVEWRHEALDNQNSEG